MGCFRSVARVAHHAARALPNTCQSHKRSVLGDCVARPSLSPRSLLLPRPAAGLGPCTLIFFPSETAVGEEETRGALPLLLLPGGFGFFAFTFLHLSGNGRASQASAQFYLWR